MQPMTYTPRTLQTTLSHYLKSFPVVGITGPRQTGKSTLLLHQLKNYEYMTFDDLKLVDFFEQDPEGFMKRYANKVIFDEIQKAVKLFDYIKVAVDRDRKKYGKYVLTASSQLSFLKGVSESLAGRIGLLSLLPFQYSEIPTNLQNQSMYKGGYPELVNRSYQNDRMWYSAYLETYLMKDVRSVSNIGDIRDFKRLIHLLAIHAAQTLNMSHYANELGVSVPTIKRWISVLEASYIIFLLPPFYANLGKRIIKSPKIYFYDTGLISYLAGIHNWNAFENSPMAGSIFENYIVSEILKKEIHKKTDSELFYFRTNYGAEIDLIIDRKTHLEWLEIKKTHTFKPAMIATIKEFMRSKDQGYLLYRGNTFKYADNISAIPYQEYLARY